MTFVGIVVATAAIVGLGDNLMVLATIWSVVLGAALTLAAGYLLLLITVLTREVS